jgi:hypothetical protein
MNIVLAVIFSFTPITLQYDMGIYNSYLYDYDHIVYFA